ncbi:MAG: NF038122 family metalloprotease [Acidobacteriota bacterium]
MAVKKIRVLISFLLCSAALIVFPLARRHAQGGQIRTPNLQRATAIDGDELQDAIRAATGRFVISRNAEGSVCRQMRPDEARDFPIEERSTPLSDLSRRNGVNAPAQTGLKITLRGTTQLDANAPARDAFLRAAAKWQSLIQTPLILVVDVDFGPTLFGDPYDPDTIGSSDTQTLFSSTIYPAVRSALISNAAGSAQGAVFTALPTGTLATDSGNATGVLTPSAVFRALNFIVREANPTVELANFGPPPSIGFNSAFPYDFDPSDGIDANKIDFEAAALHELGHVLGFVSNVGARELDATFPLAASVWDLFRFRPGVDLSTFTTAKRLLISGGDQSFFGGGESQPLSTGRPDGTDGDQEQASHWKDDFIIGRLVGLMDPTLDSGRRERISSNDVEAISSFGYAINPAATVFDELCLDDGSAEGALTGANILVVNRFTPARYPAKVETLRLRFSIPGGAASPSGSPLRIVIFGDPQSTGQPPANPTFIYDQTITIPALPNSRFLDIPISNGPSISGGDLYIGFQATSANVRYGGDVSSTPNLRSFISPNNGTSFSPLRSLNGITEVDVNLMARVEVSQSYGSILAPVAEKLSPNSAAPGDGALLLFVNGHNFQSNSVVRWNGAARLTTVLSGSQLRATIPTTDLVSPGTAQVTVFTAAAVTAGASASPASFAEVAGESTALTFTIAADRPLPGLTQLEPALGAVGGPAFTLSVLGVNFHSGSVMRWKGADRPTIFVSGVKLTATIPAADIASAGNADVTVFTPGPGGGLSNAQTFVVSSCSYALSLSGLTVGSGASTNGATITTISPCAWTASSNVPWLTLPLSSTSGVGKNVVIFQAAANPSVNGRTGVVTIGGKEIVVRQLGLLTSVSAASFVAPLAPESIGAAFGAGLASSTVIGSTIPLPTTLDGTSVTVRDANLVTRFAQLFFVSPGQINYLIPTGTASGTANVTVFLNGSSVASGTISIAVVAPSIFTANSSGSGVPAALALRVRGEAQTLEDIAAFDQGQNRFVPAPIDLGPETDKVFLILFGTGIRGVSSTAAVTASIGGVSLVVQFAGKHGSFIGQDQVNLELPRGLIGRGEVSINLTVAGRSANVVTVNVK